MKIQGIPHNNELEAWLDEMITLAEPKNIILINGSEKQKNRIYEEAVENNELIKLNQEKLPGCYLRRSDISDVARVEERTFICSETKEEAGPTNNWAEPKEMYTKLHEILKKSMKDKTMYIIPYLMGTENSRFSKMGFQLTDSRYVVLNMLIMARCGNVALKEFNEETEFVKGIHTVGNLSVENRYICHFPQDKKIYSVNSEYGGNVLQGKKCFALRIASTMAKEEGWLAEHMLILCVESPNKEKTYIAAAFPSACGKTNLAMIMPPEEYLKQGYKVTTLGDDIAWLKIGEDGRLYAINPESGFFGVAPGTNCKSNYNAMETTKKNTIFTNVVLNKEDNTVWWEGLSETPPSNAENWKGEKWEYQDGSKGAHPNSRFTSPITNCPCLSEEWNSPKGVPISAIIFGGRRAKLTPLVYQSLDWKHGVFVGASMASETTSAIIGEQGILRRDPMAMLPFCGYNMGEYFNHWLKVGEKLGEKAPEIFNVNWFRMNDNGEFIWPGFSDNFRVIEWIIKRCNNEISAKKTPIGYIPENINTENLDISKQEIDELFEIDKILWTQEIKSISQFFDKFCDIIPEELLNELNKLSERINKVGMD